MICDHKLSIFPCEPSKHLLKYNNVAKLTDQIGKKDFAQKLGLIQVICPLGDTPRVQVWCQRV